MIEITLHKNQETRSFPIILQTTTVAKLSKTNKNINKILNDIYVLHQLPSMKDMVIYKHSFYYNYKKYY